MRQRSASFLALLATLLVLVLPTSGHVWANSGTQTKKSEAADPDAGLRKFIALRFASADTLAARAIRNQQTSDSIAEAYQSVLREVVAERDAKAIRLAVTHIRTATSGYAKPASLLAPLRMLGSPDLFAQYGPADAAELLNVFADLDLRASDHRAVRDRIIASRQLDQDAIKPATRASLVYKLGYIEFFADNLVASAEAFEEAGKLYGLAGNDSRRIIALDASSSAYGENGFPEKSLACAEKAIALVKQQDDVHAAQLRHINLYLNYSEALMRMGRLAEGFEVVNFANDLADEKDDVAMKGRALQTKGRLLLHRGDYAQASALLAEATRNFESIDDVYLIANTLEDLAASYESLGRNKAALTTYRRFTTLRDSLAQSRQRETVDKLVASHQAESHQQELALVQEQSARLAAENSTHRYQLGGFALLLLCVTGLCIYVWHRLRIRNKHHEDLERKVADRTAELSLYARRLERSNADLERFAYIASHDLKTPLRNVTSFLGLIERRLTPEAKIQVEDYLKIAISNARQMHHLVTDVLEFSKINADLATQCTNFALGERIRDMVASMHPELKERSAAVVVDGHAELHAPEQYIVQLVRNLIENGIKYNESRAPLIMVRVGASCEEVTIEVSDNGIGIAEEYHAQVFELFKRLHTTDQYSGTGLGLAVCKKVVDRLGGRITLNSEVGEGSTFSITLPQNCADAVRPMPRSFRNNAYELAEAEAN